MKLIFKLIKMGFRIQITYRQGKVMAVKNECDREENSGVVTWPPKPPTLYRQRHLISTPISSILSTPTSPIKILRNQTVSDKTRGRQEYKENQTSNSEKQKKKTKPNVVGRTMMSNCSQDLSTWSQFLKNKIIIIIKIKIEPFFHQILVGLPHCPLALHAK